MNFSAEQLFALVLRLPARHLVRSLSSDLVLSISLGSTARAQPSVGDRPVTFLAVGTIHDQGAFREYVSKATPLLKAAGGAVTASHQVTDTLEGASPPGVVFAMRFQSDTAPSPGACG